MSEENARERVYRELDEKLSCIDPELLKDYLVSRGIAEEADGERGENDGKEGKSAE